jgi:hypothetical protein
MPVVFKYSLHMLLLLGINFFAYTYIPTSGYIVKESKCMTLESEYITHSETICTYFE